MALVETKLWTLSGRVVHISLFILTAADVIDILKRVAPPSVPLGVAWKKLLS